MERATEWAGAELGIDDWALAAADWFAGEFAWGEEVAVWEVGDCGVGAGVGRGWRTGAGAGACCWVCGGAGGAGCWGSGAGSGSGGKR